MYPFKDRNAQGGQQKRLLLDDQTSLRQQLAFQRECAFDLEKDIPWASGIDNQSFFLPLDQDSIAFPGAGLRQQRVLSQWMGLVVNTTISEFELLAHRYREEAWQNVLDSYPINPEFRELGEQFYEEELKHAALFQRYTDVFCSSLGLDQSDLKVILPQAQGSILEKAMLANLRRGGQAYWWTVAATEEIALLVYRQIHRFRNQIDPLYYKIHKLHFEEESRHTNYAFNMLELIKRKPKNIKEHLWKKFDLLYYEVTSTPWVVGELARIRKVKKLANRHPFFEELAECLPLVEKIGYRDLFKRFFVSAPYVSYVLNHRFHKLTMHQAKSNGAWRFWYPKPKVAETKIELKQKSEERAS